MSTPPRVVVVGGGLTGLATAWHLRDDAEVVVLEAGDQLGGQIDTIELAGGPLDVGADAFLARQPHGERLVRALGFDDELVAPATGQVWLWRDGRRRALPQDTVLGVPSSWRSVARTGALSPLGVLRAALEPWLPVRAVAGDRSVAELVTTRFGREVADRLVEPLLGGVYAGDVDRLSAEATMPPVWQAARGPGSLTSGLRAHRARTADDDRPVFLTVRGGLRTVVDRLAAGAGARIELATPVDRIEQADATAARPWLVTTQGGVLEADQVVLAVPAPVAATLLADLAPDLARELAAIRTASVGVVALAYAPEHARRVPPASGVLVPRVEGRLVKAVTVSSRKWPHQAERSEAFLLRASVGRVGDDAALHLDDATLIEAVHVEVAQLLDLDARPREARVRRWWHALPQYDIGHRARVQRLATETFERFPGLQLGGAALDGVGLAARAKDAERLAHEVRWRAANPVEATSTDDVST